VNTIDSVRIVTLLASTLLLPTAYAASKADLEKAMSYDGLQKISVKGIDLAYARPDATLAGYNRVMVDPIDVAFHKNWDPTRTGSWIKLSAEERENIRTGVAKIVYEELVKELQNKGSYQVVNEAGPDVLRVKAKIVNLYVNAPDTKTAGRSRTYTVSAGEMTIFAELYDSETGEVLARVVDRREARGTGRLTLTNSMVSADEARSIASNWAAFCGTVSTRRTQSARISLRCLPVFFTGRTSKPRVRVPLQLLLRDSGAARLSAANQGSFSRQSISLQRQRRTRLHLPSTAC
jgi:Protein of unknown function (DUF3313)